MPPQQPLQPQLFDPPEPAPPAGPLVRVRMTVAYDGGGFRGFAAQRDGVPTVAGALGQAVGVVLGHRVDLVCAGRTDAGVHAWGQVVHFDTAQAEGELDLARLQRSVNRMLGPAVVVRSAEVAPDGFHARFDATGRLYRYSVLNRDVPDPFLASTSWLVEEPLDLRAMQNACDPLFGEHDFSAFCRRPRRDAEVSLVRVVREAGWRDLGDGLLRFDIEASAFCHQMVRAVVGTLVEVGRGRKKAGDIAWILRSRDRSLAGSPAPPHGLCLWAVTFA